VAGAVGVEACVDGAAAQAREVAAGELSKPSQLRIFAALLTKQCDRYQRATRYALWMTVLEVVEAFYHRHRGHSHLVNLSCAKPEMW
jgi:hypothetical protein